MEQCIDDIIIIIVVMVTHFVESQVSCSDNSERFLHLTVIALACVRSKLWIPRYEEWSMLSIIITMTMMMTTMMMMMVVGHALFVL